MADPMNETQLNQTRLRIAEIATGMLETNASLDAFFLCLMGAVVYFMQCGFAFLEAGAVRSKNTTNILIKNVLDSFVGCIAYYVIGYGLAFGPPGNSFCGNSNFAMSYLPDNRLHFWFFQFVFSATSATIVSGAVAERCEFLAYLLYTFFISAFIYPIVSHWVWAPNGWLAVGISVPGPNITSTFMDFAGSGVVHVTGGSTSLVATAILGPRLGRFDSETREPREMPGHSVPLASLGGFILVFGFFGFNGGSQGTITKAGDGAIVAIAIVNTMISCSVGAFTNLLIGRIRKSNWSLLQTLNGALAGMVAICAGCNVVYPWGAFIIGAIAAASYTGWSMLVLRLKIDDPLDAVAVHFGGGIWGLISVAFLHKNRGIILRFDMQSGLDLAIQIIGLLAITAWAAGTAGLIFGILRLCKLLRVPMEHELKGIDYPNHGEIAYPLNAYGHGWLSETNSPDVGRPQVLQPEVLTTPLPVETDQPKAESVYFQDVD